MKKMVLMAFLVLVSCVSAFTTVYAAESDVVIYVLTDCNITSDLSPRDAEARNDIGQYWENDLIKILTKRGGYQAQLIENKSDYKPGDNTYLLETKILKYNSGSTAARMIVGFGAGACSMDIHYELSGKDSTSLLSKDDGVGSSRDWRNVARKLNENILKEIKPIIGK